jgi:mono/diheme cytochrome c family protein
MRATALMAASALLATMVSETAQNQMPRERNPEWVAPASVVTKANPLAGLPEVVAGGRKLFHHRCSSCHGDDARGTARGPDLTALDVQAQSDGALFWKITTGNTRTGMPTFSFLPEPQRWQLVMHIRTQQSVGVYGQASVWGDSPRVGCSVNENDSASTVSGRSALGSK